MITQRILDSLHGFSDEDLRSQEPPVASYRIECLKCGVVLLARVDKTPGNVRIDR